MLCGKSLSGVGQCFQIFGFLTFGFGFPNIAKTSDFEYRIRSFRHRQRTTKKKIICSFLPSKILWLNVFSWKHHIFCQKRTLGTFFYPDKERKTTNPNSNIRFKIRIIRTEFFGSNIRFPNTNILRLKTLASASAAAAASENVSSRGGG